MIIENLNTEEWLLSFDHTCSQLLHLVSSFPQEKFYFVPSENRWSPGQVCEHIVKSNGSIAQALTAKGKTTEREPEQRVAELKEVFLDFTKKFSRRKSDSLYIGA